LIPLLIITPLIIDYSLMPPLLHYIDIDYAITLHCHW
jgi:hypothetical protein